MPEGFHDSLSTSKKITFKINTGKTCLKKNPWTCVRKDASLNFHPQRDLIAFSWLLLHIPTYSEPA